MSKPQQVGNQWLSRFGARPRFINCFFINCFLNYLLGRAKLLLSLKYQMTLAQQELRPPKHSCFDIYQTPPRRGCFLGDQLGPAPAPERQRKVGLASAIAAIAVHALFVFCFFTATPAVADELPAALVKAQQARIDAIAKASASAVGVFGPGSHGGGSGVVISADGYALTNFHVVQSTDAFMKCSMNDGNLYDAVIVGIDPTGDVALIKLLGRDDFPFAALADSDEVQAGEYCFAVGNPFLLATNFQPTVSWGVVSGVHRYQYPAGTLLEYTDCIQTDAAINPGNSGGPLFNAAGELIGINGRGSFEKRGRVNVGVGYAISINQCKNFMDHLRSGRIVDHATLGATVDADDQGAVRVSGILESSQAFRRGLAYDDEILQFAGREIQTPNQFKNVLGIFPKGWRVPLTFRRDGEQKQITVRLTGVHAAEELIELIEGESSTPPEGHREPEKNKPEKEGEEEGEKADLDATPEHYPEKYKHLYIKRSGFANYYFNLEHQKRVWNGFIANGDFASQSFSWRLKAVDEQDREIVIVLADEKSGIQINGESFVLEPETDLSSQLFPSKTGGLLVALHLWRKMLVLGPEKFGDVFYFGSIPNQHAEGTGDVLVATRGAIENNFVFGKTDHKLLALEMYPDIETDPCEIYFEDYQVDGDLSVPGTIKYGFGTNPIRSIRIQQIEFLENQPTDKSEEPTSSD